ncbi:hypothetical protein GXW78_18000 [Roseomonas terrae]|jgi:hypothetical protein|uniref:Glycosyltransferase family 2 protein n=1 Tax=Neoroseomonas terrae TaxID=424799 RepID=A0ABS5EKM6_9PROT|nr:hypothetical protein [Neoroseomonas terrae]MBR0651569.1 hypothetical protein [Neoroseomonas terrae]
MRVLLALVHYFKAEEGSTHSSTDAHRRDQRAAVLRRAVDSWRGNLGATTSLTIETKRFDRVRGAVDSLDIVVITNGSDHLLDEEFIRSRGVRHVKAQVDNPRMLGFAAHRLFAETRNAYDLFCYSEDDLRIADPGFVDRLRAFQDSFGWKRLLMPNRFEWNPNGPTLKTWIDGDLRPGATERWRDPLPDEEFLHLPLPGRALVAFRRALNPHSGFFALSAAQLAHWMRQPTFLDLDCSFISPLESAATLAVLKVFPIYKAFGPDAGFLEIEHLDSRFSAMKLPGAGGTP